MFRWLIPTPINHFIRLSQYFHQVLHVFDLFIMIGTSTFNTLHVGTSSLQTNVLELRPAINVSATFQKKICPRTSTHTLVVR